MRMMDQATLNLCVSVFWISVLTASGVTHYVSPDSATPNAPFISWATAAHSIQEAVNVATAGDDVLVTNGVYDTGGQVAVGTLTNRVAVTKAISLRSVNGAAVTTIKGYQVPGTTNGESAVRCVYLTNGARLSGFTLTHGATIGVLSYPDHFGGGVFGEPSNAVVSDCIITGNSAYAGGGGAYQATFTNCVFLGNQANDGGGGYQSVLYNCLLATNVAGSAGGGGGGAHSSSLVDCVLLGNTAGSGGGAWESTLSKCVIGGNTASDTGGGTALAILENCTLTNNAATEGGGVCEGVAYNCLIAHNWATGNGGGASAGTFYNCTLVGNSATNRGGGGYGFDSFHIRANCVLYNSVIYSNQAALSADCQCTQYDSCIPAVDDKLGENNIHDPPQFIDPVAEDFRLGSASPCINSGNNSWLQAFGFTNRLDLDGNPRVAGGAVDIGAYEVQNPTSAISFAWLSSYGFPLDGSADYKDPDADGMNNFQEWRAGTNPTNSASALRLLPPALAGTNLILTWQSIGGRTYFLERTTNLLTPFSTIALQIRGYWDTTSFTDTNATATSPLFYRVGIASF